MGTFSSWVTVHLPCPLGTLVSATKSGGLVTYRDWSPSPVSTDTCPLGFTGESSSSPASGSGPPPPGPRAHVPRAGSVRPRAEGRTHDYGTSSLGTGEDHPGLSPHDRPHQLRECRCDPTCIVPVTRLVPVPVPGAGFHFCPVCSRSALGPRSSLSSPSRSPRSWSRLLRKERF